MTQSALSDTDRDAIKSMMEEWTTSMVKGEWAAWQTHWAEDGVLFPPDHARVVGRPNILEFVSTQLGDVTSFEFSDWTIEGLGDLAVVTNTIRMEVGKAGSEPADASADQMLLIRKDVNGNWLVHKVIFNGSGG